MYMTAPTSHLKCKGCRTVRQLEWFIVQDRHGQVRHRKQCTVCRDRNVRSAPRKRKRAVTAPAAAHAVSSVVSSAAMSAVSSVVSSAAMSAVSSVATPAAMSAVSSVVTPAAMSAAAPETVCTFTQTAARNETCIGTFTQTAAPAATPGVAPAATPGAAAPEGPPVCARSHASTQTSAQPSPPQAPTHGGNLVLNTLRTVDGPTIQHLKAVVKDQYFGVALALERFPGDADLATKDVLDHPLEHHLWNLFRTCCPTLLLPFVKRNPRRIFFNEVVKGILPHRDGARTNKPNTPIMSFVIHFADVDNDRPVVVHVPLLKLNMPIGAGQMYCLPGSYFEHSTTYEKTEGVVRYSLVVHYAMTEKPGGVSIHDLLFAYYFGEPSPTSNLT